MTPLLLLTALTPWPLLGEDYSSSPQVRAFLDLIARAEGTYGKGDNGYNILYGFGTFSSYAQHPNIAVRSGGITSTAAGRYQILKKTWDSVKTALGLPDFSPHSQDLAAIELIRRRGALNDVLTGNAQAAIQKVNNEWASFPGSPYGQGTRSLSTMLNWYAADLSKYNGGSSIQNIAQGATPSNLSPVFTTAGLNGKSLLITGALVTAGIAVFYNRKKLMKV